MTQVPYMVGVWEVKLFHAHEKSKFSTNDIFGYSNLLLLPTEKQNLHKKALGFLLLCDVYLPVSFP